MLIKQVGVDYIMLGVAMHTTIQTLSKKGYNKTQIAKILEIDRKTVRRILNELNEKDQLIKVKSL